DAPRLYSLHTQHDPWQAAWQRRVNSVGGDQSGPTAYVRFPPKRAKSACPELVRSHFANEAMTRWPPSNDELRHFAKKPCKNNDPQQSTNLGVRSSNLFGRATT